MFTPISLCYRRATFNRPAVIEYIYSGPITYMEHVVVNVTVESGGSGNPERGHIGLELRSPSGTRSTLLKFRSIDDRNSLYYRWPFMSVSFWGEDPSGTWRLTIKSQSSQTRVDYSNLYFQFYGTSVTPESVAQIPSQCHSKCSRGCAAAGAMFCDSCVQMRNAYTLKCINQCPFGYTGRNGYCYDSSRQEPVCVSKILSLSSGAVYYRTYFHKYTCISIYV